MPLSHDGLLGPRKHAALSFFLYLIGFVQRGTHCPPAWEHFDACWAHPLWWQQRCFQGSSEKGLRFWWCRQQRRNSSKPSCRSMKRPLLVTGTLRFSPSFMMAPRRPCCGIFHGPCFARPLCVFEGLPLAQRCIVCTIYEPKWGPITW